MLYNYGCIGSETPKQNNVMISGKKPSCCVVFSVWLALPLITTIQGVSPLHSTAVFLLETQNMKGQLSVPKGVAKHDTPTMSSRVIAQITGKEHFHVCRDIRAMLVQLYGGSDANYARNPNLEHEINQCVRCYRYDEENPNAWEYALDRKHTECLITGYDAARRMAVIDRWLQLETRQAPQLNSDQVQAGIMLLESAKRTLNLSNSSMLRGYQQIHAGTGLPDLLPVYAIDAPADAVDGSSRSTSALRTLLQQRNFPVKVQYAYQRLQELGIVQRMSRPSTKGEKQFWSITASGLMFGKNMTSPGNPRETQPHFFDSRADELLAMIVGGAQ